MAPGAPGLTSALTIRRGQRAAEGSDGAYYRLADGPGEPHLRRLELAPGAPEAARRTSLLRFAQITDLHIQDSQSPGRFEFVERFYGPEPLHLLIPAYRPQELLQLQACEAMLRTIQALPPSPPTGAPLQLLICTGDYTDNAQLNELDWFAGLVAGTAIAPRSGGADYEGVASPAWGDPAYWRPGGEPDDHKTRWGFPAYPGLLDEAVQPFEAHGVALPWLACLGNHDALIQGTARPNAAYGRIVTGGHKARALPADFPLLERLPLYIAQPQAFLSGPSTPVRPDAARRTFSRAEFVRTLGQAPGRPRGHGFTAQNQAQGSAYYVDDTHPPVRLVVLDTVNRSGHYQGSIGAAQLAWLEQRLVAAHARYWDAAGRVVESGHEDRLVVICSHHGLASLVNDLAVPEAEDDLPRALGPEVEALLHRFPNVILWVNGHTHHHTVRPRPDPSGRTAGFWEVTTSSLLDWPGQARLVEIVDNGNGTLAALCTMIDHQAPADPADATGLWRLAAIHRELAANDPHCGVTSSHAGQPGDRNVELVLPAPFPLASSH